MIVGRDKEQKLLTKAYLSKEAELIVVYGRRRVGKTYLIREYFEKKKCLFVHATGAHKDKLKDQLSRFMEALSKTFFDNAPLESKSWGEAFKLLQQQIIKHSNKKVVIFLDELPWLVTPRSGLLQLIEYYWNHHWSKTKNVILVLCGSSASWLIKNILYAKGGLHNRVTCEMRILPFNLSETKEYLKYRKVTLNNRHILSIYMALGGIPYYLKYVEPGLTAEQNIQQILFNSSSPLKDEFRKLYKSLFENSEAYLELVTLLAQDKSGMTRSEIEVQAKLSTNGGRLTERLRDLCEAGFIEERVAWHKKQGEYYKLIDEFTLFQLHWVQKYKSRRFTQDYWINQSSSQSYKSWAGYAFESVSMKHVEQIIWALDIQSGGVVDTWRFIPRKHVEDGAQIDLLIDRNDDAVTVCEIKFTKESFSIDKQYAKSLQKKIAIFRSKTKTKKQIFIAFVASSGIKQTIYSEEMVSGVATLEDLFKSL